MESIFGLEYEKVLILSSEALNPLYKISHLIFAPLSERCFLACALKLSLDRDFMYPQTTPTPQNSSVSAPYSLARVKSELVIEEWMTRKPQTHTISLKYALITRDHCRGDAITFCPKVRRENW